MNRSIKRKCFFCGENLRLGGRKACPAKNKECHNRGQIGHFQRVCQIQTGKTAALLTDTVKDTYSKIMTHFAESQETGALQLYSVLATAPACQNKTTLVS